MPRKKKSLELDIEDREIENAAIEDFLQSEKQEASNPKKRGKIVLIKRNSTIVEINGFNVDIGQTFEGKKIGDEIEI